MTAPLIRPARESDQGYVTSTWAQAMCTARDVCDPQQGHGTRNGRRAPCQPSRALVDRVADHGSVRVLVASEPTDSDRIMGWMAYSPASAARLLHFAYVRADNRRSGVMYALMKAAWGERETPIVYTLRGASSKQLLATDRFSNAVYLPIQEFLT